MRDRVEKSNSLTTNPRGWDSGWLFFNFSESFSVVTSSTIYVKFESVPGFNLIAFMQ